MFNFDTFKKKFAFSKNIKIAKCGIVLLIFLVFSLALLVYYLSIKELISADIFYIITIALLGWLFTFLINLIVQNSEIAKRLEIEAFKEVNKTIENAATVLAKMESSYSNICKQIEKTSSAVDPPSSLLNTLEEIYKEVNRANICLPEILQKIKLNFKAHEIILEEFSELLSDLENEFLKSIIITDGVEEYFSTLLKTRDKTTTKDILVFKEKCKAVEKTIKKMCPLLSNYRIEIMNKMLGPIFGRKLQK